MIEVFGGKAAYSNFWGGMDEEASWKKLTFVLVLYYHAPMKYQTIFTLAVKGTYYYVALLYG